MLYLMPELILRVRKVTICDMQLYSRAAADRIVYDFEIECTRREIRGRNIKSRLRIKNIDINSAEQY